MAIWSRFLTAIRESGQRSSRTGPIRYVILHHGATTSDEVMISMMVSGSRQVSAQAVVKDDRRTGVVPEEYRAWTSSSAYWDGHACTIECANESTNGWTISDASYESMAILLADWSTRYQFPLVRNGVNSTVFGHSELYRWFGDSYATACPGGMDIDRVVRRANEIKSSSTAGGGSQPLFVKEIEMLIVQYRTGLFVDGTKSLDYSVWAISNAGIRMLTSSEWKNGGPEMAAAYGGLKVMSDGAFSRTLDANNISWAQMEEAFRTKKFVKAS